MRKSLCAAVLSLGLLTEIAMPVIAATSKNRTSSKITIAAVEGVGGPEMWVLVRRAAPRQAPSSGGVEDRRWCCNWRHRRGADAGRAAGKV